MVPGRTFALVDQHALPRRAAEPRKSTNYDPAPGLGAVARYADDVRHFPDITHDRGEVMPVPDLQQQPQHGAIIMTVEDGNLFDIRVRVRDGGGHFGEHAGLVGRVDLDLAGKIAVDIRLPAHRDPLFRLLAEVPQV